MEDLIVLIKMDLLLGYFHNETKTEYGNIIPSIKSQLEKFGFNNYYPKFMDVIKNEIIDKIKNDYMKEKVVNTFEHVNKSHLNYHLEPYGWHALCCGLICSHFANQFGISPKIAFKLGFLHDFGKPFTETRSGKTFMHGQIGVHIADYILDDLESDVKQVILFLIDQHMCVCTHTPQERHHICFSTLQNMISSYTDKQKKLYTAYYKCLVYGDRLGSFMEEEHNIEKVNHIQTSTIQNMFTSKITPPLCYGNLFLVMHGAPGCGKSYMTNKFKEAFENYGITVGIAERDQAFWIVARKQKLVPYEISFIDFVEKEFVIDGIKTTYYKYCYPIIKRDIAEHYKNIVLDYTEKYDIVIIDSCISLNLNVLSDFITLNDMMFVWTGFPQHLLGRNGSLKVEEQSYYPLDQETVYYRSAIELYKESDTFPTPLVSSSCYEELYNLITAVWNIKIQQNIDAVNELTYPSVYLNNNSIKELKEKNPIMIIEDGLKFYKNIDYDILRLSYIDGKQNGNGTTLNYRGEHLIKQKFMKWQPLRMSLPVTPETGQLRKFNSHAQLYHYIQPLQKYLKGEFTQPISLPNKEDIKYNKCYILPKVDGSLMNVSVVKKNSVQGNYIRYLKEHHKIDDFYCEIEDNIIFIGSKSCLFATQASNIVEPFKESINKSYGSLDKFYDKINEFVKLYDWEETITIAFESVPEHPYWGLTVDYGRSFVTHLATIYYKNEKSIIRLPDNKSKEYIESLEIKELECNAESIEKYYVEKMNEALEGNIEDLEGFMLAFANEEGSDILYIKLKFPWYYAAHKPDINFREAEELNDNPKYEKIKNKLFNLQATMNAFEIKKNPSIVFDEFSQMIINSFNKLNEPHFTRKEFMIKLFNSDYLPDEDSIEDKFKEIISKFYMKNELKLKGNIASLYDVLISNNKEKQIKSITDFYVKMLKL